MTSYTSIGRHGPVPYIRYKMSDIIFVITNEKNNSQSAMVDIHVKKFRKRKITILERTSEN